MAQGREGVPIEWPIGPKYRQAGRSVANEMNAQAPQQSCVRRVGFGTSSPEAHPELKSFPSLVFATIPAFLSITSTSPARDWFAAPSASGAKDGSSQQNAAGAEGLASILDQLKPGDRLLLASGDYPGLKLNLKSSGTPDRPISIRALDSAARPVFVSDWTIEFPEKGSAAFVIAEGVSNVTFQELSIRGYQHGINAPAAGNGAQRTGLRFQDVTMDHIRHGFYLSDCSDLSLIGCSLKRYSKHGFRLQSACTNVTLSNCIADCSEGDPEWEKHTELFPFGFVVNDGGAPNKNIRFESCIARNNMMPLQTTRYKNGDGFVVERNSEKVEFKDCIAINNQDGGYDLKVKDVKLQDCVAFRNKRDYRIWTTGTLKNCYAGWSPTGIWAKGGPVVAEHCTIAGWQNTSVDTEDSTVGIELRNCLLASDGAPKPHAAHLKNARLIESVESSDLKNAGLQQPPKDWTGDLSVLESTFHRNKGFRSNRK
jgi:Right handed beta helix region